jgi:serine/threonine-protein kinase
MGDVEVSHLLAKVAAPTLVLHARGDLRNPLWAGRALADGIAGARFVELEGNNHLLLEDELAWPQFLSELRAFLGVSTAPSARTDAVRDALEHALGASYTIERELGGGGMARVFVAREHALDRDVVVKILSPELAEGLSAERFTREIKMAAALQEPRIVPVLAAGTTRRGIPYYMMPFVRGESLRARLSAGGLPREETLSILRDIAAALEHAHMHGIVHRDIKPENVLLSGRTAMVTDFGIAKAVVNAQHPRGSALTAVGTSLGTPAYMSPEQAAGDDVDARADLYAWGIVAYELLSGEHPFAEKGSAQQLIAAHIHETPTPIAQRVRGLPAPVVELVTQCLMKDPAQRPQSARSIGDALDRVTRVAE